MELHGDIETEVRACLALARAFDRENIQCPPHSNQIDQGAKEMSIDTKSKEIRNYADEMKGRLNAMYDLITNAPLSPRETEHGRTREHLIYLLGCQIYSLAKAIHKESFFTKIQQGKAEPSEGSLTR